MEKKQKQSHLFVHISPSQLTLGSSLEAHQLVKMSQTFKICAIELMILNIKIFRPNVQG